MFLDHFYTVSNSLPVNFRSVSCPLPVRIFGPVCVLVMSIGDNIIIFRIPNMALRSGRLCRKMPAHSCPSLHCKVVD